MSRIMYQKCNPKCHRISKISSLKGMGQPRQAIECPPALGGTYLRSIDCRRTTHTSDSAPRTQFFKVSRLFRKSREARESVVRRANSVMATEF